MAIQVHDSFLHLDSMAAMATADLKMFNTLARGCRNVAASA